jgi:K+-transporting ATPase c subunit
MPPGNSAAVTIRGALIAAHTEGRLLAFLREPRINVLEHLALDALK